MVTGANPTPRTVPEFLTGRPMHSRIDKQDQNPPQCQSSEDIPSVPEISVNQDNSDHIRRLADVLVGMKSKSSAQLLSEKEFLPMPSTRKKKAKERRSTQEDLMSVIENVDVILGSYSRNELESNSGDRNDEVDFGSDRTRQDIVQTSEDLGSLLISNSREKSESTIETTTSEFWSFQENRWKRTRTLKQWIL